MAQKIFSIDKNSLIITEKGTGTILMEAPARDCWYDHIKLEADSIVRIYDTSGTNFKASFAVEYPLSECEDSLNTVFTKATLRSFVRTNLAA